MFNPYAAGIKHYGSGRSFPTMGMVDKLGYRERDLQSAVLRRLKAMQKGNYMNPDALRSLRG